MTHYILYTRVSTKMQGLGLDAQRATAYDFASREGADIIAEYSEKESGKINDRPQLMAALAHCKKSGATLLIAKLDRLSRNGAFLVSLKESGINFRAIDLPEFNTMSLFIFAGLAQQERELISERTRKALAAKKAKREALGMNRTDLDEKGKKGSGNPCDAETAKALNMASTSSKRSAARLDPSNKAAWMVVKIRRENKTSYLQIAKELNENGIFTPSGKTWQAIQVQRLEKLYSNI